MFEPKKEVKFINAQNTGKYIDIPIVCEAYRGERNTEEFETEYTLHYHDHGTGQPVVFVHGAYESAYTFRKSIFISHRKAFGPLRPT